MYMACVPMGALPSTQDVHLQRLQVVNHNKNTLRTKMIKVGEVGKIK